MLRHLVLDIGNVLSVWDPDALVATAVADPSQRSAARTATIEHADWLALDRGAISVEQAIERATARSGLDREIIAAVYAALPASLTAIEATHAAVREIQAAGASVYVLSNMQHAAWHWLREHHDVYAGMRGMAISAEVGLIKPDPAIYAWLTDRHALAPGDCTFIDDMAVNCEAARAAGWHAYQLTDRDAGAARVREWFNA